MSDDAKGAFVSVVGIFWTDLDLRRRRGDLCLAFMTSLGLEVLKEEGSEIVLSGFEADDVPGY